MTEEMTRKGTQYKAAGPGYHIVDLIEAAENEMSRYWELPTTRNANLGHLVTTCETAAEGLLVRDSENEAAVDFLEKIRNVHAAYGEDVDAPMSRADQRKRHKACLYFLQEIGILQFPSQEENWREERLVIRDKEETR